MGRTPDEFVADIIRWREDYERVIAEIVASVRPLAGPSLPYHSVLLDMAKAFLRRREHRVAVVMAQTAVEIRVEQVITKQLRRRATAVEVEEWIVDRAKPFTLTNSSSLGLYTALTNDEIQRAGFWERYRRHVTRRHSVIHRGADVTPSEAADSVTVSEEVIHSASGGLRAMTAALSRVVSVIARLLSAGSAYAVVLLLGGCAHGMLGPLPPVDPAQAAEIVVIRPSGFVGCGAPLPITVDGHDAYGLACGEHVILTVLAGERIIGVKHRTWFVTDENTTALSGAARGRYYLRLDVSGLGGPVLNRITEETGRALVEKTTRLTP